MSNSQLYRVSNTVTLTGPTIANPSQQARGYLIRSLKTAGNGPEHHPPHSLSPPYQLKPKTHEAKVPSPPEHAYFLPASAGLWNSSRCMGVNTPVSPPATRLRATSTSMWCTSLRPCGKSTGSRQESVY